MMLFDLQMFGDIDIPGIDEDILKDLEAEEAPEAAAEEAPVESTQEEAVPKDNAEEPAPVDTDNVKEPEEQAEAKEEYDDITEGQTIPYDRFKTVNERRKTAESRIKELEAKLKGYESQQPTATAAEPTPENESFSDYTAEQRKRIANLAMDRAKKKLNYTDEDVEALEYSDDPADKTMYQQVLNEETAAIHKEIQEFKNNQRRQREMIERNANEFNQISNKLNSYPDAQQRWQFISQEQYNKLPARRRNVVNDAFIRLQNKQGTDADIEIVSNYFDECNRAWDNNHAPAAQEPTNTINKKITQAQRLPKAPNLSGASGTDRPLTAERIAYILNTPGEWEKLSDSEQTAILKGKI